jgi:hypothetical protein
LFNLIIIFAKQLKQINIMTDLEKDAIIAADYAIIKKDNIAISSWLEDIKDAADDDDAYAYDVDDVKSWLFRNNIK